MPTTLAAVELSTGAVRTFTGPVDRGVPVEITRLVAAGSKIVGLGNLCTPSGGGEGCQGGRVLLRLEPDSGTWAIEEVPFDGVSGSFDELYPIGDDITGVATGGDVVRVARLRADAGWSTVADVPSPEPTRPTACRSADDLWLFWRSGSRADQVTSVDARFTLMRVDLSDRAVEEVELPELAGYFGGVTVAFGCGTDGPVLTTTPPGPVPPSDASTAEKERVLTGTTVWRWVDGNWSVLTIPDLEGTAVVQRVISGERPILVAAEFEDGASRGGPVVALGETVREVSATVDDVLFWRGTTGQLVRVHDDLDKRRLSVISTYSQVF